MTIISKVFSAIKAITSLICLFAYFLGLGQVVKGRVLDMETKQPLEDVNVFIQNTDIGTATNSKGEFKLYADSLFNNTDSLTFSIVGYKTLKLKFSKLNEKANTVLMEELTNELSEVIIPGKKKLRAKLKYYPLSPLEKGLFAFGSIVINDLILVIGGSESFIEDSFRKAMEDASLNNPDGGFLAVLNELEPNGSYHGYNNELLTYDINVDQWRTTDISFENRAYHQINQFEDRLYTLGGKRVSYNGKKEYLLNTIEILDLDSLNIVVDDTNPHQAVNFASFTYKDNILVMGGSIKKDKNGHKVFTDTCHFFNITTGYWYELEGLTKPKEVNGVLIDDMVYLIGGFNGKPLSEIESLNMGNGKWEKVGDLFYAMESPSITSHNKSIYIYNYGSLLVFDTLEHTLKAYDINLFVKNPDLLYHKNKLYILGGYTEEKYTKTPFSKLFAIDLAQLGKTKIRESKKFN